MTIEQTIKRMSFVAAFEELQNDAAAINREKGFSSDDALIVEFEGWFTHMTGLDGLDLPGVRARFSPLFAAFRNARVGLKIALIMGELGETLEAVRKNLGPDSRIPEFSSEEAEVADAVIRLMNLATDRKLRLADAIFAKNEFNRTRADHSKENRATEHGKKF